MQLYFIRHAESENNALYARTASWEGRHHDPYLTDRGVEQVQHLVRFLNRPFNPPAEGDRSDPYNCYGFGLTHLYTSLMRRAVATGTRVARALGLELHAWQEIHEIGGIFQRDEDTGERTGLPGPDPAWFADNFPDLVLPEAWTTGGWWDRPHEDRGSVPARARVFLKDLLERHGGTNHRVAIFSHGGFYNAFLAALVDARFPDTGREELPRIWFSLQNTAVTRIDFNGSNANPVYFNRVDFLPAELIT